ncbi:MAG: endonuclease Q family protein [Patescibacteria group bacterium]
MKIIADLHLHSKWSRSCSKELTLPNIAKKCEKKGINLVGTADALHPAWNSDIKNLLEDRGEGAFYLKDNSSRTAFVLSTEISCIYKRHDKVRRVHHVLFFSSIESLEKFRTSLENKGCNLKSDGRPIVGLDSEELIKILLEADENNILIPAHAWTPWFSIFGSKSGFNSIEECFGGMSGHIYAIETGLSSDPAMNWRISALDSLFLVSNSDAHSLDNLGREANVFEMAAPSYNEFRRILVEHDKKKFIETLEFFPEEGKYHADGHRDCKFWCNPEETKRLKNICPKCGKPLTVGVLNRIDELADRSVPAKKPENAVPFRSLVPLKEVIADIQGTSKSSKKVLKIFTEMMNSDKSEFEILMDLSEEDISAISSQEIASSIIKIRNGQIEIRPGYDGEYGVIKVKDVKRKRQDSLL